VRPTALAGIIILRRKSHKRQFKVPEVEQCTEPDWNLTIGHLFPAFSLQLYMGKNIAEHFGIIKESSTHINGAIHNTDTPNHTPSLA
jgi:hypothetical protein